MMLKLVIASLNKARLGRSLASFNNNLVRSSSGPYPLMLASNFSNEPKTPITMMLKNASGFFNQKAGLDQRLESFSDQRRYSTGPITIKADVNRYTQANTLVFWDTENCGIPKHVKATEVYNNIKSALAKVKLRGHLIIQAVGNPLLLPSHNEKELESSGVQFTTVTSGEKQASDVIITSKMISSVEANQVYNILLVSGDGGYNDVLENLSKQGHNILWAQISESASLDLFPVAKMVWEWGRLVVGGKPLTIDEVLKLQKRKQDRKQSPSVSIILQGLQKLKKAYVTPTKTNIYECIKDGDRTIDVQKALNDALHRQVITWDLTTGTELLVPHGELLWECKNPEYQKGNKKKVVKKETSLGLSIKKNENFEDWYYEVCKQDIIEYNEISGCYILMPWSIKMLEIMKIFFDAEIKKMKVKNCHFPLFLSPGFLEKQKDHVDQGFAPEVAWDTKSSKSDLELPIDISPTSETVIYPNYSKWIRDHRDLPLKLNQWYNVVRWELSNPFRSRESLWQEGHTAFATKAEADEEVLQVLELYRRLCEEYLAVPVVKGLKSEDEKFAGGLYTTSVEAFITYTGRGVQGASSHSLGQNFAKIFNINFENEKGETEKVWQNSWAYSTIMIGVMIMTHGDDKGLVLPPKVACVQVIVIPVPQLNATNKQVYEACTATVSALCEAGIRAEEDARKNSLGWKYSHWEMKGVPVRIEIGNRDLKKDQVRTVRRDNGVKEDIPRGILVERVRELLEKIQQNMYKVAKQKWQESVQEVTTCDEFMKALNEKKLILAPWSGEEEVERDVKARTKGETGAAKTLCSPIDQPELPEGTLCFASGKPAKKWSYWGKSY